MKALLVVLLVVLVAGGLYGLAAGGVGALVGLGRRRAEGEERPFDQRVGGRRAPGDR